MGLRTMLPLKQSMQSLVFLLISHAVDAEPYPPYPTPIVLQNYTTYDYIVVGGGSAGCVVAARLAKDQDTCSNNSVLIVEAGDDPPITAILPGLLYLLQGSKVDYQYTSTYDAYAASSQGYHTKMSTGKMLGGTASLNYLVHFRGLPSAYDYWAEKSKDSSWRYENIFKYFTKSESLHDKEVLEKYPEYHGTHGPTGLTREPRPELDVYFKSFAEMGNPQVLELNSQVVVGYTQPLYAVYNNVRQTPAITYVSEAKHCCNLHYTKETRVIKVIFKGIVAVAVEVIHKGKKYILKANKEIIISAGTFGTPQLLMLSGIGPQDHLNAMNIDVIRDLPVGNNLIDTVQSFLVYKTKKYSQYSPSENKENFLKLTQFPFPLMMGSVALNKSESALPDYRSYCLLFPHDSPYLSLGSAKLFGIREDIYSKLQKKVTSRDALLCFVGILQPKSRGTVRLNSTDPFNSPVITTGYYTDKRDLENVEKYVRDFIKVGESSFFKKEGAELVSLDVEECKDKERGSSDYWQCYILHRSVSAFHYVGTCALGAVVDSKLRVMGVKNLRVADASIMPAGNRGPETNAAVMMIAEKAADMIKHEW